MPQAIDGSANARTACILSQQLTKPRLLEAAMTDVDDFVAGIHPRLVTELRALHNGDPGPRLAMWSTRDPVTLLGAGMSGRGWEQVSGIFRPIASRWSDCTDQRKDGEWKVVHGHGDQLSIDRPRSLPGEASTA